MSEHDSQNKKVTSKTSVNESSEFIRHKNNIKKAYMSALGYGDEIKLIKNSRDIELFEHLIGSVGVVIQKVSNTKSDAEVRYIAMFGDLKLDVLASEIEPYVEEWQY